MQHSASLSRNAGAQNAPGVLVFIGEAAIYLMALLLTLADLVCGAVLFALRKTTGLLLQVLFTLLMAALCVIICAGLMAIYLAAAGSGMNTTLS